MTIKYELSMEELQKLMDLLFKNIRGKNKDLVDLICMKLRNKDHVRILK